jgi:hypothetical protein
MFEVSGGYLGRPITPWTWEASAALIFYLSDRNIATGSTLASIDAIWIRFFGLAELLQKSLDVSWRTVRHTISFLERSSDYQAHRMIRRRLRHEDSR